MVRVSTTNYAGAADTTFQWATSDNDRFDREFDLYRLAQALELHDHSAGKGLSVARVLNGLINTAQLANGAVDSTKLSTDAVTAVAVALDAIGALELADNAVDTAAIQNLAVTAAKLAAGVAVSNLGYTPVNKAGDSGIGDLQLAADKLIRLSGSGAEHNWVIKADAGALFIYDETTLVPQLRFIDNNGVLAVYDGTAFRSLARRGLAELVAADLADDAVTAPKLADDAVLIPNLDTIDAPADGEFFSYDSATGRGEWAAPTAFSLPSGMGSFVATAASIPAGWTRYTNLDGRMPVGAGTTFTVTYVENTAYGTSWGHLHSGPSHAHGASALGIGGSIATNVDTEDGGAGADNVAADGHGHGNGNLDVTGNTDSAGTGDTGSTSWQIPVRAIVWMTKD